MNAIRTHALFQESERLILVPFEHSNISTLFSLILVLKIQPRFNIQNGFLDKIDSLWSAIKKCNVIPDY